MAKQHDKQFKLDAVQYYEDHKDLSVRGCAENLGIDTINKAKARRNIDHPLIIHSDCGSQYIAKEYKKAVENMQRSYSKKAIP